MTSLYDTVGHFIASIGMALVLVGVAVLIERLAARGRRVARTLAFNATYAVAIIAFTLALQPVSTAESAFLAAHLDLAPISLPDQGVGRWGSAVVLMLAEDFIFYWVHRAQHRFPLLWAMHSFHHSDDDLNATAAYRHYWLDKPFFALVAYVPLGLVFQISPGIAAAYGMLFAFFALFPHMNLRLELGPLTRIITGPQIHRLHHSIYPHHFDTNFAGAFPLWDLLFGTFREPARGEFPPTGVTAVPGTARPLEVLLWPLFRLRGTSSDSPASQVSRDERTSPVTSA
jgi:sterol desaturase/sphingolipid hydroxylase (fatty acid hydroxylase superfamily)